MSDNFEKPPVFNISIGGEYNDSITIDNTHQASLVLSNDMTTTMTIDNSISLVSLFEPTIDL